MVGPSHRASMAPPSFQAASRSRMSMAPSGGGVSGSASARIAAKQTELQALQQLRAESAHLMQELHHLSERVDTLASGGQGTW